MAGREEYAAHTWNSYPCPRDHPYTWSRGFLQRIRAVLESAADIAGRISVDLCLGMYSCPVALIEITALYLVGVSTLLMLFVVILQNLIDRV